MVVTLQREMRAGVQLAFSFLFSVGPQTWSDAIHRMGLLTAVNPVQKLSRRHTLKFVSQMILDPVTLTVLTIIEANAWGLGHPLEAGKGSRTLSLLSPEESYPIRPTVGLWPPEFSEKKCVLTKTMRRVCRGEGLLWMELRLSFASSRVPGGLQLSYPVPLSLSIFL